MLGRAITTLLLALVTLGVVAWDAAHDLWGDLTRRCDP